MRMATGSQARPGIIWYTDTGTIPIWYTRFAEPKMEPSTMPVTAANPKPVKRRFTLKSRCSYTECPYRVSAIVRYSNRRLKVVIGSGKPRGEESGLNVSAHASQMPRPTATPRTRRTSEPAASRKARGARSTAACELSAEFNCSEIKRSSCDRWCAKKTPLSFFPSNTATNRLLMGII